MRARIHGAGLLVSLVTTALAGPVALADTAGNAEPHLAAPSTVVRSDDPSHGLPADYLLINPTGAAPGATVHALASCVDTNETPLNSAVLRTVTLAPGPEGHQPWALLGTTTTVADDRIADGQVTRVPRGAPETGDGTQELATHEISASLIALGMVLGAAVTAGAIAWREAHR